MTAIAIISAVLVGLVVIAGLAIAVWTYHITKDMF